MSVRINLLPAATRERSRVARQQAGAGAVLLSLLLVLAAVWFVQDRQLRGLQDELAAEQQVLSGLQGERDELSVYADLDTSLSDAHERVRTALSGEVSFAGALQDVASVTPTDTGLTSLTLNLERPAEGAEPVDGAPIGSINLSGHSLTGHAPGVERILLELGKVFHFDEPFFNSSALDDDGVATFNLDVGLLPESLTGRYDEGVPEELR